MMHPSRASTVEMQIAVGILLSIHELIHLLGFLEAFPSKSEVGMNECFAIEGDAVAFQKQGDRPCNHTQMAR
jgi:hypothetical protein